jgi:uncharacterized protein (DUF362 family)
MGQDKKSITRRDFIRAGSCVAMGGIVGLPLLGATPIEKRGKSRVVLIRDEDVLDGQGMPRPEALERMLDDGVTALLDAPDPVAGWRRLVKPSDIVGIKSNVWSYLPTPPSLVRTIEQRLEQAGVKKDRMDASDRKVLNKPVFQNATALINARPMRTHHWSGLGTLLKNYIMFVPEPWKYHGNSCERLGAIWQLPHVKGKTRLNILVMLTPLFHGIGPHHYSPRYTWRYGGLILSTDPVAADATGARIIQAKRIAHFGEERTISPPPLHIAAADTRFKLGHSRAEQIDLIKVGSERDILV